MVINRCNYGIGGREAGNFKEIAFIKNRLEGLKPGKFLGSVLPCSIIIVFTVFYLLTGCFNRNNADIKRYDLFSIPLGTLPNEIDWFYRDNFRIAGTADIHTRDGLIYISAGEAGKVMVFNSYGNLITYIYDPIKNPRPVSPQGSGEKRSVVPWSFINPRFIAAVDGGFLVEDGVDAKEREEAPNSTAYNDRVILKFSNDGKYLGHIGREGNNGTPFPYIVSLDVRVNGSFVVTGRVPQAWMSYWFTSTGVLLNTIIIHEDQLPGREKNGNTAVYSIRPDPVQDIIHIRLDIYPDLQNGEMPIPRLYTLDINTLKYLEPIVLNYINENPKTGFPSIPPDYLGTTKSGHHMMLTPEGVSQYRLALIDREGRVKQNRQITVKESGILYRRFRLQNDGMLAGIFFDNQEASVAWWRSDKLIE